MGDQSIRTLAQHCHNIEHLDLTECKKITDAATEPLSKHCNKLQQISLESCSQVSDLSLKSISDGCPVSQTVYVQNKDFLGHTDVGGFMNLANISVSSLRKKKLTIL